MSSGSLALGNSLHLPWRSGSIHAMVSSCPYYGNRVYAGVPSTAWPEIEYTPLPGGRVICIPAWTGCLGLEPDLLMYVAHLVAIYREMYRCLDQRGVAWLNIADGYAADSYIRFTSEDRFARVKSKGYQNWLATNRGSARLQQQYRRKTRSQFTQMGLPVKNLLGVTWRVAFALMADGWDLVYDAVWAKGRDGTVNGFGYGAAFPSPLLDRPMLTHECVFAFAKGPETWFDRSGLSREFGSVWTLNTGVNRGSHTATYPEELVERCLRLSFPASGERPSGGLVVGDAFVGSGTTCRVAARLGARWVGVDLGIVYLREASEQMAEVRARE